MPSNSDEERRLRERLQERKRRKQEESGGHDAADQEGSHDRLHSQERNGNDREYNEANSERYAQDGPRGRDRDGSYYNRRPPSYHDHGRWEGRGRGGNGSRGPPARREYDYSDYRRRSRSRSHPRSRRRRSRSPSSSVSRSRSRSRSASSRSYSSSPSRRDRRSDHHRRHRRPPQGRSSASAHDRPYDRSRGSRRRSYSDSSHGDSSAASSHHEAPPRHPDETTFSSDQRTVFVSQLVMRATERDLRNYFRKTVGCLVRDVILLRDKRTRNHKGCAYVEMASIEDLSKAVAVSGQPPDFQRFPILVKTSEAEKNYQQAATSTTTTATSASAATSTATQNVYVGNLDPSVAESHLFALFSQFGPLDHVSLPLEAATKTSRGYAFLSFRDLRDANLAIQTMANQLLAGRRIKTGWASQVSTMPGGGDAHGTGGGTTDQLPADASLRVQKALSVLAQMTGSANVSVPTNPDVASATTQASPIPQQQQQQAVQPQVQEPTPCVLVHNMFDKDQEEGTEWPNEIKLDFQDECSKFGTILEIKVLADQPGGKIVAQFQDTTAAMQCANNLQGRWFDQRQLRVEYLTMDTFLSYLEE